MEFLTGLSNASLIDRPAPFPFDSLTYAPNKYLREIAANGMSEIISDIYSVVEWFSIFLLELGLQILHQHLPWADIDNQDITYSEKARLILEQRSGDNAVSIFAFLCIFAFSLKKIVSFFNSHRNFAVMNDLG